MSVACHYTNLTNALLIPQRIERRSHPYQKCALPIKLRNLYYRYNILNNLNILNLNKNKNKNIKLYFYYVML